MKKLTLLLLAFGNLAFADAVLNQPVINQQYVTANPTNQPQSQVAPTTSQSTNSVQQPQAYQQQPYQAPQNTNSPMDIYNTPSQTQQGYQSQDQSEPQYAPQPQANPNQAYAQPQYAPEAQPNSQYQPQYQQPMQQPLTQGSQWQTRPQDQSQGWQTQPTYQQPQQQSNYQQPAYQNSYPTQPYQSSPQPMSQQQTAPNYQQPMPTVNNPPAAADTQGTAPMPNLSTPMNLTTDTQAEQTWYTNCLKAVTSQTMTPYANAFCQCGWQKITASGLDPNLLTSQNPADIQKANMILQGISQECLVIVMKGQGAS